MKFGKQHEEVVKGTATSTLPKEPGIPGAGTDTGMHVTLESRTVCSALPYLQVHPTWAFKLPVVIVPRLAAVKK